MLQSEGNWFFPWKRICKARALPGFAFFTCTKSPGEGFDNVQLELCISAVHAKLMVNL